MMVFSYWEQACALLNYGLLHEDLFFKPAANFLACGALRPILQQGRERFGNKQFLAHVEKAATRYETWIEARSPGSLAAMREFSKQLRAQLAKGAHSP